MFARSPTPSVLIADAEYYICRVLEAKLSKDNRFEVVCATSGLAALQAALERSFDVLLWDLRLRETLDLLPRLRALCPNAVLFLMTTDDRPVTPSSIQRLDVADVLVKPFGLDTLVDQLYQAISAPQRPPVPVSIDLSRVGQQLTLISPAGRCVTRVLERSLDTFTIVGAPRVETPPDFAIGLRVRVQVRGEDALYSFNSRLLRSQAHPVLRWELRLPRAIQREQRRKYPRVPLHMPVVLMGLPKTSAAIRSVPEVDRNHSPDEVSLPAAADGITEDLSLGGCALVSEQLLPVDAEVSFDLKHAGMRNLEGYGRILRTQKMPSSETWTAASPRYRIAVQFTEIDPSVRRKLRFLLGPRA
jgi:c-di-GMP-binding flagellar brake protein YcgR/ActR/RegA family two-component response regulator